MNRSKNESKPVTIHDVAKCAGVSLSTVSRVLNEHSSVNPQTREKVEAVINKLNYEKTRGESTKQSQMTKAIGLIIPDIINPFFPLLVKGVEQVAKIHGYSLILCDSENNVELEQQHINTLYGRGIDGIIIIPSAETTHLEKFIKKGIPFVFLDRFVEIEGANHVISDNQEGAYQALKYLLKLGHRDILHLTGPNNLSTERARIKGCRRALAEEKIEYHDEMFICANYNLEDGYNAIEDAIRKKIKFTAIFVTNDMMAFGAKKALEEYGLKIPDDVSLVGYDDILFSSIIDLTSVSQPTYEMGRNAMVLLLDLINGRIKDHQHIVLRPSMVIRSSCKRK